jgi:hypothetical protein
MRLIACSSFTLKMIQLISSLHGQQQQLLQLDKLSRCSTLQGL